MAPTAATLHSRHDGTGLGAAPTSTPALALPIKDVAVDVVDMRVFAPTHKPVALAPLSALRHLQRDERFTSGTAAVRQVAGNLSENVFIYPLLTADAADAEDDASNTRAREVTLEIRAGAASAVRGALAVGTTAAAFVPSQTLPLFLPSLFDIASSDHAAVFHVSCEAIRADLAVGSSYESVYALQHAGALLLNSSSPQECHDLAVVAHVAALRLNKLLVHFYDGSRVAREQAKLNVLTPASLTLLADAESKSLFKPLAKVADIAEQVQVVMDDLFQVLQKQYNVYEYYGAADAELVIAVMGEATAAIQEAVAYEQMLGVKVGVVQVRLLLPWSHALFAKALPATTKRVAVLENMSPGGFAFQRGLLTQNVQVFFQSEFWAGASPAAVLTGIYGGVFRNWGFSLGMGRAVLAHLSTSTSRRSFIVAKSESLYESALGSTDNVNALDVIYGAAFELTGADAYSKQYLVWGYDEPDQRTEPIAASFASTLEMLNRNPSTQLNAVVSHSVPSSIPTLPRSVSTLEARLSISSNGSKGNVGLQQGIDQADVTVVTRAELLQNVDIVASVKPEGTLLVHTSWKTIDDIDDEVPGFKAMLGAKNIELLVVDVEELQTRAEEDAVANVAPQVAFFKAAGLFDESVVLALLKSKVDESMHAMLRAFVESVWGDVRRISYSSNERRPSTASLVELVSPTESSSDADSTVEPLPSLASLAPSKISHSILSASKSGSKRGRGSVSKETAIAWQLTFPEEFGARHGVRDHVTDVVRVTKWERLTPATYDRNVFHIEMDITNTAIKYNIGEALAVFAHNDEKDVLEFLRSYNVDPEALVTLPVPVKQNKKNATGDVPEVVEETLTYFQLFSQVLDVFGRPSKKFYQALAANATDEKETEVLSMLIDADSEAGKEEYKRRVDETLTFADLLVEFPSARPSLEQLVTLVPRIKPRHYSIASSMKMNPTSVHLLIVVHDWTTPSGKHRIGQATRFLSTITPGQLLSVSVCSSVMKLPVNHADPIIMAGLGTGMAPFRAFIQERALLKSQGVEVGPIALYFGSRNRANEFLYGEELEQYEREGLLTYLRCAFSRDQAHKIYIQDRIAEDKELLADLLLNKNGHFYLCGPTWPVADVREALVSSFMAEAGMDRKQANAYIERMRDQGRYVLEVY